MSTLSIAQVRLQARDPEEVRRLRHRGAEGRPRRLVAADFPSNRVAPPKNELTKQIKTALERVFGTRSSSNKLTKLTEITDEEVVVLDFKPAELMTNIKDQVQVPLQELSKKMKTLHINMVEATAKQFGEILMKIPTFDEQVTSVIRFSDCQVQNRREERLKEQQQKRYKVDRLHRLLATGGFGRAHGRNVAATVIRHEPRPRAEDGSG